MRTIMTCLLAGLLLPTMIYAQGVGSSKDIRGTARDSSGAFQPQFGGSIGFPIKKDRTFLFFSCEGLRQNAQNAVPLLTNTSIIKP